MKIRRKYIEIKKINEIKNKIKIKIIKQSHRRYEFGIKGLNYFMDSTGFELRSCIGPSTSSSKYTIFVRGESINEDNRSFFIKKSIYKNLKNAVKEYNSYFKGNSLLY